MSPKSPSADDVRNSFFDPAQGWFPSTQRITTFFLYGADVEIGIFHCNYASKQPDLVTVPAVIMRERGEDTYSEAWMDVECHREGCKEISSVRVLSDMEGLEVQPEGLPREDVYFRVRKEYDEDHPAWEKSDD